MKKLLLGIVVLLVVLGGSVVFVPPMIDWNEYKGVIAEKAMAAAGRRLEIRGDINIELLPAPALVVGDVRVANIAGAADPDMMRLKSLAVRLALVPLLSGNVLVESVRLVEPVIHLETLADGRTNLAFDPPEKPVSTPAQAPAGGGRPAGGAGPAAGSPGAGPPPVRVESFVIERGTLIYRDGRTGRRERMENLNARFAAASLSGPLDSSGSAVVRGVPLSFTVSTGTVVHGRTMPYTVEINVIPGEVKARLSGTLAGLGGTPRLKGKLAVTGADLKRFLGALGDGAALPDPLARSFTAKATLTASAERVGVDKIEVALDGIWATGKASLGLGKKTEAKLALAFSRLDLDRLLKPPEAPPAAGKGGAKGRPAKGAGDRRSRTSLKLAPRGRPAAAAKASPFALPKDLDASLNLSVEGLAYRGGLIRQIKLNAALANGEITINQFSAQLPGASDVALFGFVTADAGKPAFEGNLDLASNDLRGIFKWLGVTPPAVPPERLRKFAFSGKVKADAASVGLSKVDLRVDGTRFKGAANIALRKRPSFGVSLSADRLNLDGYLARRAARPGGAKSATGKPAPGRSAPGKQHSNKPQAADPLAGLGFLGGFDANIRVAVGALTYGGLPIRNVRFDGTLHNGRLSVRQASAASIAGVAARLEGALAVPMAGRPGSLSGLTFDFKSKNLTRFFKLAEIKPPVSPRSLGAVRLTGRADGSPSDLALGVQLTAAGGELTLKGKLGALAPVPRLDADITLSHPDLRRLLRAFGVDYRPRIRRLGGIDLAGHVKGDASVLGLTRLSMKIGPKAVRGPALVTVRGSAALDLRGPRPKITADLTTDALAIEQFLPAKRTAARDPDRWRAGAPLLHFATWSGARPGRDAVRPPVVFVAARGERWSRDPIDVTVLNTFDADLRLRSPALGFEKYVLKNATLVVGLKAGILTVPTVTGSLFGGALNGRARVQAAGARTGYQAALTLTGLDGSRALKAVASERLKSGTLDLVLDLASSGGSVADMVGGLQGTGSLAIHRLDVGTVKGTALAGVLDLVTSLNSLAGTLGGRKGKGLAEVAGSFQVSRGIARFEDLKLGSNLGDGTAKGSVDLPNWRIDATGQVTLAQNLLLQVLNRKSGGVQTLPFSVTGPLDDPKVKLETGKLPGRGIAIPGLDRLRKKRGIGTVLDRILGPSAKPPPPQAQPAPPPGGTSALPPPLPGTAPTEPKKKKLKPEDFIKDIFRSLGR